MVSNTSYIIGKLPSVFPTPFSNNIITAHFANNRVLYSMYTTNINIIASIPDFNLVLDVISSYAAGETKEHISERVLNQNVFGIRTGKSRSRFLDGIISTFISFKNDHHKSVFFNLFKYSGLLRVKQLAIYCSASGKRFIEG